MEQQDYVKLISNCGIRPSVQRLAIYEYLANSIEHPSVDMVFASLSPSYPTLSRTTVYNTIHTFVEKGIVREVYVKDGESRYDANLSPHLHFICSKCGKIIDIFDAEDGINDIQDICSKSVMKKNPGYKIEKVQVNILGLCSDCNN
ncbi:MAG: transcriptional repressor [Treponema sp.]|nr:transcriptional repressor [Treponema sp.]